MDATSWAWEKSPLRDMNDDGPWLLKQEGLLWDLSACMHVCGACVFGLKALL